MLKVLEAFSGIGSQAKALKKTGIKHKIIATVDWDINAIYAYDIIHNGKQDLTEYLEFSKKDLLELLKKYTLSINGKNPTEIKSLASMHEDSLRRILCAIKRSNNLVSITDVKAEHLPEGVDLLTYSFPCQDLSICGAWHGNNSGIDRNAKNRSGMLWEIERILKEYVEIDKKLPKFLLMENVSNILSENHRHNFKEWQDYLEHIGYINKVYTLDSSRFGIPQKRIRTYMVSVYCSNNKATYDNLDAFFTTHNLSKTIDKNCGKLSSFLRLDYSDCRYKKEADISNPNDTPSRVKIYQENTILFDGNRVCCDCVGTITTKQDRNPNSGLIMYPLAEKGKSPYRNLTPRECFLLMGFEEKDFQQLLDNDFVIRGKNNFCTREKLIKMAGNSIVVNVLEEIFKQIDYINKFLLTDLNINETSNF